MTKTVNALPDIHSDRAQEPSSEKLASLFETATQAHQTGQWELAAQSYQQLLTWKPDHADAWHLLALVYAEQQRWPEAWTSIDRAIALVPHNPVYYCNRAQMRRRQQQWDAAILDYQQAIRAAPRRVDTYLRLADTHLVIGRGQEAILHYLYACYLNPQQPPTTHHQLGNAFLMGGHWEAAITAYEKALALNPRSVETLSNLGLVYAEQGRLDQAVASHRQALVIDPQYGDGYINLGLALSQQGRYADAENAYQQALRLKPEQSAAIYTNRSLNQQAQGDYRGALDSVEQALTLQAENPKARFNRAILRLRLGDFRGGWADYEARFQLNDPNHPRLQTTQPLWQGEDLAHRRLLVYAEQGLGDTWQFLRYLPVLKQRQATLIVQVQPALLSFFKTQSQLGVTEWMAVGDSLPLFDYHVGLMSLPQRLQTEVDCIPPTGYLQVKPPARSSFPKTDSSLRVGLVWAGNPQHKNDHHRSLPLSVLAPLLENTGVAFYSLQHGPAGQDIQRLEGRDRLVDLGPRLQSWEDSAQLLTELDLLITVDTSVAHLSGSLGRPTWILLPFVADFRWLVDRTDSPWYPSVRLFRQPQPQDWTSVIAAVQLALTEKAISSVIN